MAIFFPIMLEVEEAMLGPILRMLKDQPGVRIHLNLDDAGKKPAKLSNGMPSTKAQKPSGAPRINDIIIAELTTGQKNLAHLKEKIVAQGGSAGSLSAALHLLQKKGITESGGPGVHKLTDAAMREWAAPAMALPAPGAPKRRRGPETVNFVLESIGKGMPRKEFIPAGVAMGLSKRAIESSLSRLHKRKEIFSDGNGVYRLAKSKSKS